MRERTPDLAIYGKAWPVRQEFGRCHLELRDGLLNDLQSVRETEPIRIDRRQECGLMHREPDGVMGDEQGVEFLDHPHRLQTTSGTAGKALVIMDFIND